VDKKIKFRW